MLANQPRYHSGAGILCFVNVLQNDDSQFSPLSRKIIRCASIFLGSSLHLKKNPAISRPTCRPRIRICRLRVLRRPVMDRTSTSTMISPTCRRARGPEPRLPIRAAVGHQRVVNDTGSGKTTYYFGDPATGSVKAGVKTDCATTASKSIISCSSAAYVRASPSGSPL